MVYNIISVFLKLHSVKRKSDEVRLFSTKKLNYFVSHWKLSGSQC